MKPLRSKPVLLFLLLIFFINTANAEKKNWIINPGVNVGPITCRAKKEDLVKIFDANNVKTEKACSIGEGSDLSCIKIYPNSANEIKIFTPGLKGNTCTIEIAGSKDTKSRWKTNAGLHIGMSLAEMIKINKKPITFYGFEFDGAGTISSFESGHLSDQVKSGSYYSLGYGTDKEPTFELAGDQEFKSSDKKVIKVMDKLYLQSMQFNLN